MDSKVPKEVSSSDIPGAHTDGGPNKPLGMFGALLVRLQISFSTPSSAAHRSGWGCCPSGSFCCAALLCCLLTSGWDLPFLFLSSLQVGDQANAINTPGTAFHTIINSPLEDVQTFFPIGCMHSVVGRVPIEVSVEEPVPDVGGSTAATVSIAVPGEPSIVGILPHHQALPMTQWTVRNVDICIYVGQSVDTVVSEFVADTRHRVLDTAESLRARIMNRLEELSVVSGGQPARVMEPTEPQISTSHSVPPPLSFLPSLLDERSTWSPTGTSRPGTG